MKVIVSTLERNGKEYPRVKVGDPGDFFEDPECLGCNECGSKRGEYHILGCDTERCPICGGQLISCDCFDWED